MITEFENSKKRCISVPNLHKNKKEKEDFDENKEKRKNEEKEEYILGNYKLGKILGEGTFGMIFKCESSDGLCAFKFEKKRPNRRSLLKAESDIMITLKGPGIPRIFSYIEEDDYNIMIMELLGKSLEGLLKQSLEKNYH